jgi:hypothetical protein
MNALDKGSQGGPTLPQGIPSRGGHSMCERGSAPMQAPPVYQPLLVSDLHLSLLLHWSLNLLLLHCYDRGARTP